MPKLLRPKTMSEWLAEAIAVDGRSLSAIARAAGVSKQYMSDLKTGNRGPKVLACHLVPVLLALGLSDTGIGRLLREWFPAEGK